MSKRTSYKKSRTIKINKQTTPINRPTSFKSNKKSSYYETLKLVKQANAKIVKLRQAGYKGSTWASKKLNAKLQTAKIGAWHRGKVKINENMTETQLLSIRKSINQFLSSKTSTPRGIEKVKKKTIESLAQTLSDEDKDKVNSEDAEFYYDMLGEKDFDFFADKIGASILWICIDEAIEDNDTEDDWLSRLSNYITLNDEDYRNRAIRLYHKYVG